MDVEDERDMMVCQCVRLVSNSSYLELNTPVIVGVLNSVFIII